MLLVVCMIAPAVHAQDTTACSCPDWMSIQYRDLESALKNTEEVTALDLSMQKLSTIDARVAELKNLTCLDLSFNRFSKLPGEITQLENLQCLKLTGCRFLRGVPEILKEMKGLKYLDIGDHPEWSKEKFEAAKEMLPGVKVVW